MDIKICALLCKQAVTKKVTTLYTVIADTLLELLKMKAIVGAIGKIICMFAMNNSCLFSNNRDLLGVVSCVLKGELGEKHIIGLYESSCS